MAGVLMLAHSTSKLRARTPGSWEIIGVCHETAPAVLTDTHATVFFKAFISTFAASIAAEVKSKGIDVMAFHPSPVASRFYDDVKSKIDLMEFFKKFSVPAEQLPDEVFKAIGYSTWRDIGGVAIFFRMFGKLVDYNLMMVIFTQIAHTFPDYKRNDV